MLFQETIARKRDGIALSSGEINSFVSGYTAGEIPDYQVAALLMAIYIRGMDLAETADLTGAMAASGRLLDLSDIEKNAPTLDKHSTGGVGDKTSLVVVPILAAAGIAVCKMSGRGLGHTGGTLDKLESIPGFRVDLTPEDMVEQVRRIGACLAGQTSDLAPADKLMYALRDSTATVGSLPLIVSSILSKKLAGGARRFLFDVKLGSGALMKDLPEARALAAALVDGAAAHGRSAIAVITDMSQPLGRCVGNALEIEEAIEVLNPATAAGADARFRDLCRFLAAEGLLLSGVANSHEDGLIRVDTVLASGQALSVFREIVGAQGGDITYVDNPSLLPKAPIVVPVLAPANGFVTGVNAAAIGEAVVRLGGGRATKTDVIDHAVGFVVRAAVGDAVSAGTCLGDIHARDSETATAAAQAILAAYEIGPDPVAIPRMIVEIVTTTAVDDGGD